MISISNAASSAQYAIASAHPLATKAGIEILEQAGNAFVYAPGRRLISGTPGGSRIITMQLLGMLEFLRGGSAEEIVSLPRFHHQYFPDNIYHEDNTFDEAMLSALKALGHELKQSSYRYGNMQTIVLDQGKISAASGPRGIGSSIVAGD